MEENKKKILILFGIAILFEIITIGILCFIEKNKNIPIDNEVIKESTDIDNKYKNNNKTKIKEIEKIVYVNKPIEVIKQIDNPELINELENLYTINNKMNWSLNKEKHISFEESRKIKHHHYIVPDSEFNADGFLINNCTDLFKNTTDNDKPTLMHKFIKKINPLYGGWICWSPSFNENIKGHGLNLITEIKAPPLDLVGIYFDNGERYSGNNDFNDWNKYNFYDITKQANGAENIYYFWRSAEMFNIHKKIIQLRANNNSDPYQKEFINKIASHWSHYKYLNERHCPSFAKLLTEEDIEKQEEKIYEKK